MVFKKRAVWLTAVKDELISEWKFQCTVVHWFSKGPPINSSMSPQDSVSVGHFLVLNFCDMLDDYVLFVDLNRSLPVRCSNELIRTDCKRLIDMLPLG